MKDVTYSTKMEGPNHELGEAQIQIRYYEEKEAKKRARKALLICCGLAVAGLFLPIAHFFLVPGFLIAGIFAFLFFKKQSGQIVGGEGTCTRCQTTTNIPAQPCKWPITFVCDKCRTLWTIKEPDEKLGAVNVSSNGGH